MTRRFFALILAAVLLWLPQTYTYAQTAKAVKSATAKATKLNPVALKSAEQITAEQLKDYLTFIASDALEGRNTPSRGLDTAAQFIATLLSRWGLKPAGDDGTYFQRIALRRTKSDGSNSILEIGGQKFSYGADFLATSLGTANGSLVFAGNGWMIQAKNMDAYQGIDVKGKIVVIQAANTQFGMPQGISPNELKADERGKTWADPVNYAQMSGAIGVIQIANQATSTNWERTRTNQERERTTVEKFSPAQTQAAGQTQSFPMIVINQKAAQKLFEGEAKNPLSDANTGAFDLAQSKQANIKADISVKTDTVYTQNVVAVLEGSDPKLKSEYVAIGAHYDHVGINANAPAGTDSIYNGADDDGSGTVATLAMAEAFANTKVKPKRSILFVWHCGEERGLWGSRYFTEYPTVPIQSVVAQLNMDMIGRSKPEGDTKRENAKLTGANEIYIIGTTMMSTTLGELSKSVNDSYLKLSYNPLYDSPDDPERIFYRSDHFNYARKGIPILFFFDGVHEDYHRVGDHVEKIDFQKMEKIARTVYMLAWSVANLPVRPAVDKPLPQQLQGR